MAATIKTVFCYSHTDEAFVERLRIQLKSLQREGYIDIWYDRDISAGKEWQREIDKELSKAQLILLLVSPDFMASDYCYRVEMKRALERHEQGKARVIPIILRPIRFKDAPFSKLQVLPKDAKPITGWSDTDEAFANIEDGIRKAVKELKIEATARRNPYCILVVDDEPSVQRVLRRDLKMSGYEILIADHGRQAVEMVHTKQPDLILLDLGLPGEIDGIEVCKLVRQWSQVPIIIVSARSDDSQKVQALDFGADDYLTKPFSRDELLARVRAILRRAANTPEEKNTRPKILSSEDGYLSLDIMLRQVHVGSQEVKLTPTEFELLRLLMLHPGKVLTHRVIIQSVWGPEYGDEADYLRVYVRQLRRKIEPNPSQPRYVLTEPGAGYIFMG